MVKAKLIHKSKQVLNSGLIREMVIWRVPVCHNYPEGIKFRFVIADQVWRKVLILFDNHAPKGPHWHDSVGNEYRYEFLSMELLIDDFRSLEFLLENKYENNEN